MKSIENYTAAIATTLLLKCISALGNLGLLKVYAGALLVSPSSTIQ